MVSHKARCISFQGKEVNQLHGVYKGSLAFVTPLSQFIILIDKCGGVFPLLQGCIFQTLKCAYEVMILWIRCSNYIQIQFQNSEILEQNNSLDRFCKGDVHLQHFFHSYFGSNSLTQTLHVNYAFKALCST